MSMDTFPLLLEFTMLKIRDYFSCSDLTSYSVLTMLGGGKLEYSLQFNFRNITILFPASLTQMLILLKPSWVFCFAGRKPFIFILIKLIRRETKYDFQLSPWIFFFFNVKAELLSCWCLDHSIEPLTLFSYLLLLNISCQISTHSVSIHPSIHSSVQCIHPFIH